ncbi:MAG TPA: SusC/RagA family TonB-linked outer membrane protein [Chitinophagaceae bacterium]|nr:SusC/RagA family TonB-linked outer membrane protein [Chitinophagaceae bacterium]
MKSAYLKWLLMLISFFCFSFSWGQVKQIAGTILSEENNSPLSGASITIKESQAGTQSGTNGEFTISANVGQTLVISFTGFLSKEIKIESSTSQLIVTLRPEAGNLGEVVVVGYGTQSRRNITGAIGKLDKAVLQNAPRSNVGTALQGSVAGLRVVNTTGAPGASPSILLRGGASINSPGSPLVIVDGIVRSFNDISSDDIESIELLKDAASTAIYGARANNGVILITTKQGKAGKAQVSYKYVHGYNTDRPDYQYMNAKDYVYYGRLGHFNSQRTLAQVNSQRGFGLSTNAADLALFDIRRFDASTQYLLQAGWDTVGDPYGGTIIFKDHAGEIKDILFRNTNTNDHYLSVMGGNDKGKYFSSFDYYTEDGVIVGSDYKRFSGTLNGSYKIRPDLEVSSGATFSTASGFGLLGGDINTLYRNVSLWPTMNPWLDSAKTMPNPGNGITDGNPLYWLQKNYRKNEVNRLTGNASVKYDIIKDLYIKASANIYLFEAINESFTKATQTYTQIYANTFNTTRPASWSLGRTFQQQYNAIVNYRKRFGNHNLEVMEGVESFGQKSLSSQVSGTGAPTDDILTVNASTVFSPGSNFSSKSEYRIISNFGRANYDYDQRYLLTLVYRYDGISSLATENRWGFFPGMSAGWNVHREKFFESSSLAKIISSLKPRVSYGINGNVSGIGDYEVQGGYGSQGNYNGSLGFLNTDIINSGLRWEKSKTTDIGLDLGLLNNRVTLIFDYYDRKTSDLLTNLTLPSYVGFSSIRTNLGTFQNKGYEFGVNANILETKSGVKLDASANISYNKNKILKLPFNGNENNRQGGFQIYDAASGKIIWVGGLQEGQPLGAVYAYKQLSIFQDAAEVAKIAGNRYDAVANITGPNLSFGAGKITAGDVNWLDVDKNDTIDSRDQVYVGNINPKVTGGFTTTLSYKGFSLYTRWDFALGHVLYNDLVARVLGNYQGTFNFLELTKQGFSGDNSRSDIPKVYWADQVGAPNGKKNLTRGNNANPNLNGNNSNFYEKGDYLACREITLSYDFGRQLLSKTKVLSQARAYVNFNNMFYITKFSGNSPEPKLDGLFRGNYPTPKSFVAGIQITF